MLRDPLFIIAAVASLTVLGILALGIANFARGGEFHRRHANRLMRWRLGAQFIAVLVIVALAWLKMRS